MIQTVTVPGTLPALNEIINASKAHWSVYRKERDEAVGRCRLFIRRARLVTPDLPVYTHYLITPPDYRKDPGNLGAGAEKVLADALEDEGFWPNDGHKQVASIWHNFTPKNPQHPQTQLTLIPHTEVEQWLTGNLSILLTRSGA